MEKIIPYILLAFFIIGFVMAIAVQIERFRKNRSKKSKRKNTKNSKCSYCNQPAITTQGANLKLCKEHLNLFMQALNTPNSSDNAFARIISTYQNYPNLTAPQIAIITGEPEKLVKYVIKNTNLAMGRKYL